MADPLSTTITTYNQRAAFFVVRNQGHDLMRHFGEFIPLVAPHGLVLDVGCGPGWHSVELIRRGFRAMALDLSHGMLREAWQMGVQNLVLADMRQLPITDYSVDGLWVSASFLHVPRENADSTLREFHRVLKVGGAMYLGVKGGEGERFGNPLDGLPRYFIYWTEEDLDARLRAVGFKIVRSWVNAPEAKETRADTWINRVVVKQ
jgi:ubiquinone/menaquinone biosynthesis C-methylase UbiE